MENLSDFLIKARNVKDKNNEILLLNLTFAWLQVSFDHVEKVSNKGSFSFASDVRIDSIQPRTTIRSGGLPLHVTGVNLNLIQNPQLVIAFKDFYKSVSCVIAIYDYN